MSSKAMDTLKPRAELALVAQDLQAKLVQAQLVDPWSALVAVAAITLRLVELGGRRAIVALGLSVDTGGAVLSPLLGAALVNARKYGSHLVDLRVDAPNCVLCNSTFADNTPMEPLATSNNP